MRIKVLMITDEPVSVQADIQLLKDHKFLVYTCYNADNLDQMIMEIEPDLIFVNPMKNSQHLSDIYNEILTNLSLIKTPVIYTLSEDDVYMVTRKRTIARKKRTLIADNMLDAIKSALETDPHPIRVHSRQKKNNDFTPPPYLARA